MNLLDVLMDFNEEAEWETTLDDIGEAVLSYNEAVADGDENPGVLLNEVLPVYWQAVRAHNIHQWRGENHLPSQSGYDVGIFLVGFSSLPIVLSIAEIQPRQKIYFIHSHDTEIKCNEISNRLTEILEDPPHPFCRLIAPHDAASLIARVQGADKREIADPSDPVSTFGEIKDIIDHVRGSLDNKVKIALDLTGGKKTMIGGGFTAGSIYSVSPECKMFYVDSSEYDPERGAPIPGTEFLSRLDNPYDVYNVQTVAQATELYKRHNYEATERLWSGVRDKLYRHAARYHFLENERKESGEYYGSSHCYYPWDALDYTTAVKRKTYRAKKKTYSWGYREQHVHGTIDVLDILAEGTNKSALYANERRVIHYAVDRYQNGMRRKQSKKLEDAIVRFAQVIEMICNYRIYRLARNGFYVSLGTDPPRTLPADKKWEFGLLIRLLFGSANDDNYYVSQDQQMAPADYGCRNVDQIISVIQPRNDFIHFNNPMSLTQTERDTENLRNLAHKFLENFLKDYCGNYCDENGLSLDCLLELHRFRR